MKRISIRILCLAVGSVSFLACATAPSRGPSAPFAVAGNLPDATVWVDDHLAGRAADFTGRERRIPAGFHRVEIRYPGYYSQFEEIDAKAGTPQVVRFDLHPVLP